MSDQTTERSEEIAESATADIVDRYGTEVDVLAVQWHDVGGRPLFEGPVRTVRCHRDNGLVKRVLATPGDGAVLVVDGSGSLETALMGDLIATSAVENRWAGVVVLGAVRDRLALGKIPLGVKALGFTPRKSAKAGDGEVDVPLVIAGTVVAPGAMLWADPDGVVVRAPHPAS